MANKELKSIKFPTLEDTYIVPPDLSAEVTALQGAVSTLNTNVSNIPNGTYPNLTAGSILTDKYDVDTTPYLYRAMPYVSKRLEESIVGGSVVWNQYAYNPNFASATNWGARYGTVTVNDNIATVTPTSDGTNRGLIADATYSQAVISGHKYFLSVDVLSPITSTCGISFQGVRGAKPAVTANVWATCSTIYMDAEATQTRFTAYITGSVTTSQIIQYKNAIASDLTAMFGSTIADYVYTLEQATAGSGVAWLKARGFFTKPYYAYDTGTIKSVEATAHITRGVNAWDEEWEVGGYNVNTGEKTTATNCIRSKNFIPVVPNTRYFINAGYAVSCCYDANGNYLRSTPYAYTSITGTYYLDIPSDAYFITFNMGVSYGATYKNDICINMSDPTINGQYFPYEEHTYPLGDVTLRGIPKLVNNELVYDGDIYTHDGSVKRIKGFVQYNGSENWGMETQAGDKSFYIARQSDDTLPIASIDASKWLCNFCPVTNGAWTVGSMRITSGYYNFVLGSKLNISTVDAWKTYLASHPLQLEYELTTPTTETTTPFEQYQVCETGGTEEYTTTNDVPVGHDTKYFTDVIGNIENIPAPPTANGTYTLKVTVSASGNTYAWV